MAAGGRHGRTSSSLRTLLLENASPLVPTGETRGPDDATVHLKPTEFNRAGRGAPDLGLKRRTNKCKHRSNDAAGCGNRKSRCRFPSIYGIGKGAGCKVGACDEIVVGEGQKPAAMESTTPRRSLPRAAESSLECFSHGISDLIRKKSPRKVKEISRPSSPAPQFHLPDDLLELCLLRLPFKSLHAARLVCKKWLHLTTSPQFLQLRCRDFPLSPWLLLFGVARDGFSTEEIHALDTSLEQWHIVRADLLAGRFLFAVAAVGSEIYVVGGRSNSANAAMSTAQGSSVKTHRGVLVFSPLTGKWRKASPLKIARSAPVLGVLEVSSCSSILRSRRRHRCHLKEYFNDEAERTSSSSSSRFLLIAVGGKGSWDEPLDSAEIYDPTVDRWTAIEKPPEDLGGAACTAAALGGAFYVCSESGRLARYDADTGVWTRIETSSPPPRLHAYRPVVVSCDRRLFMLCVSWGRAEKALRKLWELDLDLMAWSEVASHPDAPMDMDAVFVAERSRIYGMEMFRIFGQVLDFLTTCDVSGGEVRWSRISTRHAGHPVAASSCSRKSMVVLSL